MRWILSVLFVALLMGCVTTPTAVDTTSPIDTDSQPETTAQSEPIKDTQGDSLPEEPVTSWLDERLVDIRSGEPFTLRELSSKPVLLESFAVWCPTCKRQQQIMKEVNSAIHVSLDTDPNEDEDLVRDHALNNGFDWYFALSPPHVTRLLINEFGVSIVSAPSVPMILICPDGSYDFLDSGLKSKEDLESAIATC